MIETGIRFIENKGGIFVEKIKQTTRRDGLRIISKRLPYTNKVMFSVTSLMGAASDSMESLGLAHYFEHMVHQGTKTRDKDEIRRFLGRYCTFHNADTSHLRTRYFGECAKMNYRKMFEGILDIYCNPIFPEDRIENERGVIENEILMRQNDDGTAVFENLIASLYGRESLAGRGIAGSVSTIATVNRDLLLKMHKQYYSPVNSVIIVTGDLSHRDVVTAVNEFFPIQKRVNLSEIKKNNDWINNHLSKPTLPLVEEKRSGRECSYICLGIKMPNRKLKESLIVYFLKKYFRNIIFDELRQKRGLVYSASAGEHSEQPLYSIFYLYAETSICNTDKVTDLIKDIVLNYKFSETEFDNFKEGILAESSVCIETVEEWNYSILKQVISNPSDLSLVDKYYEEVLETIRTISFDEVMIMRKELFKEDRLAFSIITNKAE